jgi:hypothetical protein
MVPSVPMKTNVIPPIPATPMPHVLTLLDLSTANVMLVMTVMETRVLMSTSVPPTHTIATLMRLAKTNMVTMHVTVTLVTSVTGLPVPMLMNVLMHRFAMSMLTVLTWMVVMSASAKPGTKVTVPIARTLTNAVITLTNVTSTVDVLTMTAGMIANVCLAMRVPVLNVLILTNASLVLTIAALMQTVSIQMDHTHACADKVSEVTDLAVPTLMNVSLVFTTVLMLAVTV